MKKKKILFADLDGTLIKTASGMAFPEDITDFRIRLDVLNKIKSLGIRRLAIVSNQGGIPEYVNREDFLVKLECISDFITKYCNCLVWYKFCTSIKENDHFRKPNCGMLEDFHKTTFRGYDKNDMIMIGDASGKPGQFSDSDKKCAENFSIDYMDVEDFIKVK